MLIKVLHLLLLCVFSAIAGCSIVDDTLGTDPLPSWREGDTKHAIIAFVQSATVSDSTAYVAPSQRIAAIDNDGTLWSEQPAYFQLLYTIDKVKSMSADHPEWVNTEPFKTLLGGYMQALSGFGVEDYLKLVMATHSGMTEEQFNQSVREWLAIARHPTTGRPFTQMAFQPMLELLAYLHANQFKVFIVSGGGIDFVRSFSEPLYGVPPERVIGSSIKAAFEMRNGVPVVVKQTEIDLIDDGPGKPVSIHRYIGQRPILTIGNSDGDLQMLQYTTIQRDPSDTTPRLGVIIHHTDAKREWAYDRESSIGRLNKALDESRRSGWLLVDMHRDWARIYSGE